MNPRRWLALATVLLLAPIAGAQTSVQPSQLSFGSVNVGSTKTLTALVTNSGSTAVKVYFTLNGGSPTQFALVSSGTPRCGSSGTSLKARSSCYQGVQFKPTVAGAASGSLIVTTVGSTTSTFTIPLSGSGVAVLPPALVVSPVALTLSGVCGSTTPARGVVSIANGGGGTLQINGIAISAPNGGYSISSKCGKLPAKLAAGASCTVTVSYSLLTPGTRNATLSVSTNVGTGTVPITGSCGPPASP
jgi:hypothetical protein